MITKKINLKVNLARQSAQRNRYSTQYKKHRIDKDNGQTEYKQYFEQQQPLSKNPSVDMLDKIIFARNQVKRQEFLNKKTKLKGPQGVGIQTSEKSNSHLNQATDYNFKVLGSDPRQQSNINESFRTIKRDPGSHGLQTESNAFHSFGFINMKSNRSKR